MGILDRIGNTLAAFGGAAAEMPGIVKDIATAPFDEDDISSDVTQIMLGSARSFNSLTREDSLVEDAGNVIGNVFDAMNWVYREGVSEPIVTAGGLGAGLGWDRAREKAQTTSIGQFFAEGTGSLMAGGEAGQHAADRFFFNYSPDDPFVRDMRENSRAYNLYSGTLDFGATIGLDPFIAGGKFASMGRKALVKRPIAVGEDVARNIETQTGLGGLATRTSRTIEWTEGKRADEILNGIPALRDAPDGPAIAELLSRADKLGGDEAVEAKKIILRSAYGDLTAIDEMGKWSAGLQRQLDTLHTRRNLLLEEAKGTGTFADLERTDVMEQARIDVDLLDDKAKGIQSELAWAEDVTNVFGKSTERTLDVGKGGKRADRRLASYERDFNAQVPGLSRLYQSSLYDRAIRYVDFGRVIGAGRQARPRGFVNLHDPDAAFEVEAMLRNAGGLDIQRRGEIISKYMGARNESEKLAALDLAERAAQESIASSMGLKADEVEEILNALALEKGKYISTIRSRSYSASKGEDGKTVDLLDLDGEGNVVALPVIETQLPNDIPLMNVDLFRRTLEEYGPALKAAAEESRLLKTQAKLKKTDAHVSAVLTDVANIFNRTWKTGVLTRGGYPLRNLTDENARVVAKVGAVARLGIFMEKESIKNRNLFKGTADEWAKGDLTYRGVTVPDAFKGRAGEIARKRASSEEAMMRLVLDEEGTAVKQLRGSGQWRTLQAGEAGHLEAWADVINKQFDSPLVRAALDGGLDQGRLAKWIDNSPEGRALKARMPHFGGDSYDWAGRIVSMVNDYLPEGPLREAFLAGERVTPRKIAKIYENQSTRPPVHGEAAALTLGQGKAAQTAGDAMGKVAEWLGSIPADRYARHPFYAIMYRQHVRSDIDRAFAQADELGRGGLTNLEVQAITRAAHEKAVADVRNTLFSNAARTNLANSLRFLSPFFSAWQDVVKRWSGIIVDKPQVLAYGQNLWGVPNAFVHVVDQDGNEVEAGSPFSEDTYIQLALPEWAGKPDVALFGDYSLEDGKLMAAGQEWVISKQSFNLVLQNGGLPGFGPIVQIPANELMRHKPELEEVFGFISPYGPSKQGPLEQMAPATLRRLISYHRGEDDPDFKDTLDSVMRDMDAEWRAGERDTKPTMEEALERTKQVFSVRFWNNFVMPFVPQARSPYQFYIDSYRKLEDTARQQGAENPSQVATQQFVDQYGMEFFDFTQSSSRNMTGLPATVQATQAYDKWASLIAENPDNPKYARRIIGSAAVEGEFSMAAYRNQQSERVAPGVTTRQRETGDPALARIDRQVNAGWYQFRKMADQIDGIAALNGLAHWSESDELKAIRKAITASLVERYPDWANEFQSYEDPAVFDREVQDFVGLAAKSPEWAAQPRVQTFLRYAEAREAVLAELEKRDAAGGSADIGADSNADLAMVFDAMAKKLVSEGAVDFSSDFFNGWLENDPLLVNFKPALAFAQPPAATTLAVTE